MAVRFDASGDRLSRTTANILNALPSSAFSVCAWVKRKVDTGAFATAIYLTLSQSGGNGEVYVETETGGDVLHAYELGAGVAESDVGAGPTLTIDTWFFAGYRRTNTARSLLYGTQAGGTLTKLTNTDTRNYTDATNGMNGFQIGNDPFNENFNGEIAYVRLWNVALSDAEFDAEWRATTPVRTSGLRGDWRLAAAASAATDSSGNSLTLTVGGTLADGGTNPTPPAAAGGFKAGRAVGSNVVLVAGL